MAKRSGADCASWPDLHARQLELFEVLRRNVAHPRVAAVHVLVGEARPVLAFLEQLPWFHRHGCKVHLVETGRRPSFRDYMVRLSVPPLLGRTVVFTNQVCTPSASVQPCPCPYHCPCPCTVVHTDQDIFLTEGWGKLAGLLKPHTALMLSRHHQRVSYDLEPSLAAAGRLTSRGSNPRPSSALSAKLCAVLASAADA